MISGSSKSRVAIVGGGLSGSLAALVLKQRLMNNVSVTIFDAGRHMLGGRLLGGYDDYSDGGAQFFRPQSNRPELLQLTHSMESMGLLQRWEGRFGMLGSQGGGFLPSSLMNKVLHKNNSNHNSRDHSDDDGLIDGGDFCGFAQYAAQEPTYVAVPSMKDWCRRLVETEPDIQISLGSKMVEANYRKNDNEWELQFHDNPKKETFDALIISTHDPSLAGQTLQSIISTRRDDDDDDVVQRFKELQSKLQTIRDCNKLPVYSCSFIYPPGLSKLVPLDAASIPGSSTLQFISREASKPQRPDLVKGGELWKAVSTTNFASKNMNNIENAQKQMQNEMSLLLSPFMNSNKMISPQKVRVKLWRAAFSLPSLQLKEDCVSLYPWRFIISGDYISNVGNNSMTPLEAAAISGLQAGEHMSNILSS